MEKEAIEQALARAGWEVDYGFSGHLTIGNAGDLSILAPPRDRRGAVPEYEIYDAQRNIACRVEVIPTPIRAGMLLEEHGVDTLLVEEVGWTTSSY